MAKAGFFFVTPDGFEGYVEITPDVDGDRISWMLSATDEAIEQGRHLGWLPKARGNGAERAAQDKRPPCPFHGTAFLKESKYGGWYCTKRIERGEAAPANERGYCTYSFKPDQDERG